MAITKWTRIQDGQNGDEVSDKLDTSFGAIDVWQEEVQGSIDTVAVLDNIPPNNPVIYTPLFEPYNFIRM